MTLSDGGSPTGYSFLVFPPLVLAVLVVMFEKDLVRIALRVVGRVETPDRPIHPTAQGGDGIGRLPTHYIIRVAMDRAVTVGHRQCLAQRVDSQHIFRRAAAGPGGGVRVAHLLDQVVGVQTGTATRGDPVYPFSNLLPAGGQHHPHRGQARRVVGGFGGLVIGVRHHAIDIVLDRLGDIAQGIEITPGLDPPGINKLPGQPSRVVGGSGDQHRVGPAGDRGRPGVAGATVGTNIHHPSQTVGAIEVAGGIADPGLHSRGSSPQGPVAGLIVEAVPGGDQDRIRMPSKVVSTSCSRESRMAGRSLIFERMTRFLILLFLTGVFSNV